MSTDMNRAERHLSAHNLSVGFQSSRGQSVRILDQVSISVAPGSAVGIAGESGSGKSTLLLAMMGFTKAGLSVTEGECFFDGNSLFRLPEAQINALRGGRLALIPQNAGQALTPTLRIGTQIEEALELHANLTPVERKERVVELLSLVCLPDPGKIGRRFPHELSGGQQQRVAIAMAMAGQPEVLLLDEPTTGLDVTTQLQILDLLCDLRAKVGMTMVCVSHDIGVLAKLSDRIAVMYAGQIVEERITEEYLRNPAHPYSRALLNSLPSLRKGIIPPSIPGKPPAPHKRSEACRFAPRCAHAQRECHDLAPNYFEIGPDAWVRCRFPQSGPRSDLSEDSGSSLKWTGDDRVAISVNDLSITYAKRPLFGKARAMRTVPRAVNRVDLELRRGEILGLVGESGSGKSTILRALAGLWPVLDGKISFDQGFDLTQLSSKRDREILRRVQLVFQNPDASLNPRHTVRDILHQPLQLYFNLKGAALDARTLELLTMVRLDGSYLHRLPGQLSGGEKQRIAIARAFAADPDVILCDEITSALDVSVQASILRLVRDLSITRGTACILVTHDLAVVRALAHQVAVLYKGKVCEFGRVEEICERPQHPYTQALVAAVLEPDPDQSPESRHALERAIPSAAGSPGQGCAFVPRCPQRLPICSSVEPPWVNLDGHHHARCQLHALPLAEAATGAVRRTDGTSVADQIAVTNHGVR